MKISELLKTYRTKHHCTQEQLAEKLFVTHQSISKWEQGVNVSSSDNLIQLSELYNLSLDELIRGSLFFGNPL
ncbi:helix-turn-helix transcriptional regulator [uncultured Vagococcus sp.]|uniref:helix-turn-helix domain-containing protein n=1 Tax=uncultured Vagococcus sp. TaxID=189676 RepID=UPI0028D426B6|nr:helix-turn-helix transcriptional regulator [uncultured Vagococcus sp.]